jgi:predicted PhzF superfamily epimerase YddE/YHI9
VTAVPYWHVDAFADRPFGGNQAAVMVLEDWLADDTLLAIARETGLPATAFVAQREIRWFSPAAELRLCGHASLAAGHALLAREGGDTVTFHTREVGVVTVHRSAAGYEMALPAIPTAPGAWPEAVRLLGTEPREVWRSPDRYNVFLYDTEAQVRALDPDLHGLGALGNHQFICSAPGTATDVASRVFVPGGGVDEDSVTGSAHAVLAPIWTRRLGRSAFTAHQASMRGGNLACRLDGDRVWLGGACVTVVEGTFYLSG